MILVKNSHHFLRFNVCTDFRAQRDDQRKERTNKLRKQRMDRRTEMVRNKEKRKSQRDKERCRVCGFVMSVQ
jgi:hypothetical protein